MLNVFIRSLIIYVIVVVVMRIMGKRQLGQLQPFELVITLMIAELGSIPMENVGRPLIDGLIPIFVLTLAQLTLSYLTLKSERIRAFICGSPSIVIQNGKINQRELARLRLNLNDLLEQLRANGITNVSDVEFAIIETVGKLNVIPKSQKRPVTPADLKIATDYEGIPFTLIMDGHIHHQNLSRANKDIQWLEDELKKRKLQARDVFFASLDTQGNLDIQPKEGK